MEKNVDFKTIKHSIYFLFALFSIICVSVCVDPVKAWQSCGCDPLDGKKVDGTCVDLGCPAGYSGTKQECQTWACCRECWFKNNPLGGVTTECGSCGCSAMGKKVFDACVKCPSSNSCQSNTCKGSTCTDSNGCVYDGTKDCTVKKPCNSSCTKNSECTTNYCYFDQSQTGFCRNSSCKTDTDCVCDSQQEGQNGVCGSSLNNCTKGTLQDTTDSSTHYLWNCLGSGGGSTASCSLAKSQGGVNGSCGSSNNSCLTGTLQDTTDSSTHYLWNCLGSGGGSTASCSVAKPCVPSCVGKCTDPKKYTNQVCGNDGCGGNCYGSNVRPTASLGDVYAGGAPIYAYDPQGRVNVYLTHDGNPMATLNISGNYTYRFTPSYGTHRVCLVYVYDNPSGDRFTVNRCDNYTHYNPDDYKPSCTKRYELWNDGLLLATSDTNTFTYTDQVKRIMVDKGGVLNYQVRAYVDQKCWRFYTPPPDREPTEYHKLNNYTLREVVNFDCSIPESIKIDPASLTFDYRNDSMMNDGGCNGSVIGEKCPTAVVECTHGEHIDITENTVEIRKGELEACFDVVLAYQNRPYNIYSVSDNYLISKCLGEVNFYIADFLFDNENWGPLNGYLSLEYNPATDNTSERFEYSGDVIVNPPPGFDQFIFPSF